MRIRPAPPASPLPPGALDELFGRSGGWYSPAHLGCTVHLREETPVLPTSATCECSSPWCTTAHTPNAHRTWLTRVWYQQRVVSLLPVFVNQYFNETMGSMTY